MGGGRKKNKSGIPASEEVVFVGGIPQEVTQCDVRNLLNKEVGGLQRVRFMICHATRHHKGFGFARFVDAATAQRAILLSEKKGLRIGHAVLNIGPSCHRQNQEEASSNSCSASSGEGEEDYCDDIPQLEEVEEEEEEEVFSPQQQQQQQQCLPQQATPLLCSPPRVLLASPQFQVCPPHPYLLPQHVVFLNPVVVPACPVPSIQGGRRLC